nr:MAG TPA: hypothetical protein [Caudoviricetes sp.]
MIKHIILLVCRVLYPYRSSGFYNPTRLEGFRILLVR